MKKSIIKSLVRRRDELPPKQQAICTYILENYRSVAMMTASQLATAAGVGEATIFRFLKAIGYPNYSEFKNELFQYSEMVNRSTYWQMRTAFSDEEVKADVPLLMNTAQRAVDLINKSITEETAENFNKAVDMLLESEKVCIFGLRSSKAAALYFEYLLMPFFPRLIQFSNEEHMVCDRITQMEPGGVLFAIGAYPNTATTTKACELCKALGHQLIVLVNSPASSLIPLADVAIVTATNKDQYNILPFIVIIEALADQIGIRMSPQSVKKLEQIDALLKQNGFISW